MTTARFLLSVALSKGLHCGHYAPFMKAGHVRFRSIVWAVCLLVVAESAQACLVPSPVTWTFYNVQFDDGTSLSGSFDYNTYFQYADWNITTATTELYTGYTYDIQNSYLDDGDGEELILQDAPDSATQLIALYFSTPLTNAGGTVGLSTASFECVLDAGGCVETRYVTGGSVMTADPPTPEPPSFVLFSGALIALAKGHRYSRRRLSARLERRLACTFLDSASLRTSAEMTPWPTVVRPSTCSLGKRLRSL